MLSVSASVCAEADAATSKAVVNVDNTFITSHLKFRDKSIPQFCRHSEYSCKKWLTATQVCKTQIGHYANINIIVV